MRGRGNAPEQPPSSATLRASRVVGLLAARFYPRQPQIIAAVTGTNGKTSVVHFTREIWAALGHPAASLGTLGTDYHDRRPGTDGG